jgi:hypothetical protein
MNRRAATFPVLGLVLLACGGSRVGPTPAHPRLRPATSESPTQTPNTAGADAATRPGARTLASEQAHGWLVEAVGCWLGGVWSDAEGAKEEERINAAKQRCRTLVQRLYGGDDSVHYEKLRALEQSAIADLSAKITAVAQNDAVDKGREQQLIQLLQAIAAAEREAMSARRAANDVKNDIAVVQPSAKRKGDELAAVAPLSEGKAFEALLRLDVGDLSHEARVVAILYAVDRMETARGLPTHLKAYAVARPFAALFGAAAPDVRGDASEPIKGGIWLRYLTAVAKAAGHPVPENACLIATRSSWLGEAPSWGLRTRSARKPSSSRMGLRSAMSRRPSLADLESSIGPRQLRSRTPRRRSRPSPR